MLAFIVIAIASGLSLHFQKHPEATPEKSWGGADHVFTRAIVSNNPGGVVKDFIDDRDRFIKDNTKVEIAGECASACTLFLSVPKVCIHPGASFAFHAPFINPVPGYKVWSDDLTADMLKEYPVKIQEWITKHGGLGPNLIYLGGEDLKKLVPSCDDVEPKGRIVFSSEIGPQ